MYRTRTLGLVVAPLVSAGDFEFTTRTVAKRRYEARREKAEEVGRR